MADSYCVIADVEARAQVGAYSTTTKPTLAQVNVFLEQRAGEIYNALAKVMGATTPGPSGYALLIDQTTDKGKALADMLSLTNAVGTAADALDAAGAGESPAGSVRVEELRKEHERLLTDLLPAAAISYQGGSSQFAATHISTGQSRRFIPAVVRDERMVFDRDTEW